VKVNFIIYTEVRKKWNFDIIIIIIIIIIITIASHEDEMNNKYNDKLCTSNEVISEMSEEI